MDDWKFTPARDHGLPLSEGIKSSRREDGLVASAFHLVWWTLVSGYLRLVHRLRIEGQENLPAGAPFILIANHTSHLDALVLSSSLPARWWTRVLPVAAGDTFFTTPARSYFAALALNALPLWRKNAGYHALTSLRERLLERKCIYVLFPEGTRTRDGQISEFKPGLGMIVAGTDVPVVPCYLDGCHSALPAGQRFPRPRPIVLRIGAPLDFRDLPQDKSGWAAVATRAQEAVQALCL